MSFKINLTDSNSIKVVYTHTCSRHTKRSRYHRNNKNISTQLTQLNTI